MNNVRVVVTGLGIVCPIGNNVNNAWKSLLDGVTGVTSLGESYTDLPCTVGALIKFDENTDEQNVKISKPEQRTMTKSIFYALIAGAEALKDAKFFGNDLGSVTGVSVGMGMVDMNYMQQALKSFEEHGYRKLSPYFVPAILPNMAAGQLSVKYGLEGPNHAVSTACATGAHAIGDGLRIIQSGQAKMMVCGGTDSCVNRISIAGFCKARSLATKFNKTPEAASRPFDTARDGFVMGEGSAIVVLEELHHALERNCKIYAELLGYGMSGDASHLTAPRKDGEGVIKCIRNSLIDSQIRESDVTYINAHATSTQIGDLAEGHSIAKAFPHNFKDICVSSTKGHTGHLLGAAGSAEAIFTILSCFHKVIPPTLNLTNPDTSLPPLKLVKECPIEWNDIKRIALTNSFGFGGTNCSLCFSNFNL